MIPHITILFVAIFALFQLTITMMVGFARQKKNVHFYDDGDVDLRRRVRAHGNFTETVPITLLAMAGAEIIGTPTALIWAAGITLLVGRLWHYYVIRTIGWSYARAYSMLLTFIAMAGLAIAILWQTFA